MEYESVPYRVNCTDQKVRSLQGSNLGLDGQSSSLILSLLYYLEFYIEMQLKFTLLFNFRFVTPKVMSHRFTLANTHDKIYTDYEKKLFKDLVNNCHTLMMTVTPPEANPMKQYCELFRNCKNIKKILEEMVYEHPGLRYTSVPLPSM